MTFTEGWIDAVGKMSHYKPNLPPNPEGLTPNCAEYNFETMYCDSATRSKEPWELWENCSLACPKGYMYSLWKLPGGETFICLDTGGKIIVTNSSEYLGKPAYWLDLLLDMDSHPPVPYGAEIPVRFKFGKLSS